MSTEPLVVVDASVLLLLAGPPDGHPSARDARETLALLDEARGLSAPALLAWELGQVVHAKAPERFGASAGDREELVDLLVAGVRLVPPDAESLRRTARLVTARRLSFYDASYLELALRAEGSLLLTDDERLLRAARRALGPDRAFDAAGAAKALLS